MDAFHVVKESMGKMENSPVRKALAQQKDIPFENGISDTLCQIDREGEILESKIDLSTKIVLMGEVKAGKSTVLNCFVGSELSDTDVLEATASIIEVRYSNEEYSEIHKQDGSVIKDKPEEIKKILDGQRGNMEFFKECDHIKYNLSLETLKEISLVDTPGIATVTFQNAQKAKNFIQKSDVVIWVLNSNHLGQMDIEESLQEVAKMGKPIILVANRIDEVAGDSERILDYIEEHLGIYAKKVFPLSAFDAYTALQSMNQELLKESGFVELRDYIINEIENNARQVQNESIITSMKALFDKDLRCHNDYKNFSDNFIGQIDKNKELLMHHHNRITHLIKNDLTHWLDHEFFKSEMEYLYTLKDQKAIQKSLKEYFSESYIRSVVEQKAQKIVEMFNHEWRDSVQDIKITLKEDYEMNFNYYRGEFNNNPSGGNNDLKEDLTDGVKKGATVTGTYGAVLAGYAAWLGPGAAYITIGSALTAMLPPLLIAGAAAGAVSGWLKKGKNKESVRDNTERHMMKVKSQLTPYLGTLVKKTEQEGRAIVSRLDREFIEDLQISHSREEINDWTKQLNRYIVTHSVKQTV